MRADLKVYWLSNKSMYIYFKHFSHIQQYKFYTVEWLEVNISTMNVDEKPAISMPFAHKQLLKPLFFWRQRQMLWNLLQLLKIAFTQYHGDVEL